jgi:acyl-CoA synthetase (AMP-forming)/AMP-acid ligase II
VLSALRRAAADPDRPAVIDGATGHRRSRGELAAQSAALASALAERGVGRGDQVAVALPNTAWWPVIALGIWRAGAAVAPFGLRWTAEETRRALARVRPRVAVTAGPSVSLLREAGVEAGIDLEVVAHGKVEGATPLEALLEAGALEAFAEPRLAPTDLAVVPFSSGTGALPKGSASPTPTSPPPRRRSPPAWGPTPTPSRWRPSPEAGEVPVAYVVLSGPATPDELIAFTASRLAAHKRPHDVRIVDQLPRMPTGKLQRRLLRDRERHAAAARARAQRS